MPKQTDRPEDDTAGAGGNAGRTGALIEAWLDQQATADELSELNGLIVESAAVRAEFWERGLLHGLLYEAAKTAHGSLETPVSVSVAPPPRRWLSLATSLALVLAGGLVGGLAVSRAGLPTPRQLGLLLHCESFEGSPPGVNGRPKLLDTWNGDETTVVDGQRGITPPDGEKMLRFVNSSPQGSDSPTTKTSEIWRFIDLDQARSRVAAEAIRVELTAVFNDAQGADAAARCGITLVATDADPRELSGAEWLEQLTLAELRPEAMAVAEVREIFDSQRSTWQPVSAAISVPARARYLIAHCWAEIRRPDDPTIEQFSQGRFVDDVSIHVMPNEPEWR